MTIYFSLEGVLVDHKLQWLAGSKEFFEGVSDFAKSINWDVKVLAKYNKKKPESKSEIYDWCIKNLGLSKSKIKPVPNNEDKLKYANPETFLIDPKIEIVNGFMYSGGTAILFDGLASGVKKLQLLIEAIKECEADKNLKVWQKNLQNPQAILGARLRYLFKENGFDSPYEEYISWFNTAYDEVESYLNCWADSDMYFKEQEEMGYKFGSIICMYNEHEEYEEYWRHAWESITTFPVIQDNIEFKDELQKKLFEFHMKDNSIDILHYDKTLFSKILKNIEHTLNIRNFFYLDYFEQVNILMFVYLNLVANMLQEELAGKDN